MGGIGGERAGVIACDNAIIQHAGADINSPMTAHKTGGKVTAKQAKIAADLAELGIRLLPQDRNKKPLITDWPNAASADMVPILEWAKQFKSANFAALCGESSDLLVIDIDVKNDQPGRASWKEFANGRDIDTYTIRTPSGGEHRYYKWDPALDFTKIQELLPGVEAIGNRQCATIPGSFYASGGQYVVTSDVPIAPPPAWLVEKIRQHKPKQKAAAGGDPAGGKIAPGERNAALTSLAGTMQRRGVSPEATYAALRIENDTRCDPPLPLEEVKSIVKSVLRYKPAPGTNVKEFKADTGEGITSKALLDKEFTDPQWIVSDLLPEGMLLLAGKPKTGKSWLALQIAAAASVGVPFLNHFDTMRSKVLYLALEDTERRLRKRFDIIKGLGSDDLIFHTDWPRGIPGIQAIKDALEASPDIKLLVIDTLVRFLPDIDFNSYSDTYPVVSSIKHLSDDYGVSILAVVHTRKSASDDFIDTVTGSNAFTGATDATMVLTRGRGDADGFIVAAGRDMDDVDIALKLVKDVGWEYLGEGKEHRISDSKRQIIEALKEASEPIGPKDVSAMIAGDYGKVKLIMYRMEKEGLIIKKSHGKYDVYE